MKISFNAFLFVLIMHSCQNDLYMKGDLRKINPLTSSNQFSIEQILHNINETDSLLIIVDIGISDSWHKEVNVIKKKKNNTITIYSINDKDIIDDRDMRTIEKEIIPCMDDTLCFEYLINGSGLLKTCDDPNGRIAAIYNNDTSYYCTSNIIQSMKVENLYIAIKRKLFPSMKIYKKIEIPK